MPLLLTLGMRARASTTDKLSRRGRPRRRVAGAIHVRVRGGDPASGGGEHTVAEQARAALERRDLDPSQDTAVYSCGCGTVFEGPVSTSVSCPHCGMRQAW